MRDCASMCGAGLVTNLNGERTANAAQMHTGAGENKSQ